MLNKSILTFAFFILSVSGIYAQITKSCETTSYKLKCVEQQLDLIGSKITIKTYTKTQPNKIIDRTFVIVHANEEKGLDAAKKAISDSYGRLVEVGSNYEDSYEDKLQFRNQNNKRRYLYFDNGQYCVDPNRIYTKVGIAKNLSDCQTIPDDKIDSIFKFGRDLIKIVTNNNTHKFIIGVHNNGDTPLSLDSWSGSGDEGKRAVGIFKANNHQSGDVVETGNFLLVSNIALFVKFSGLEEPSNIVLQESRKYLIEATGENKGKIKRNLDDGSMSIYFGSTIFRNTRKPFDYINIEAEGKKNVDDSAGYKKRQMKTIELVITKLKI